MKNDEKMIWKSRCSPVICRFMEAPLNISFRTANTKDVDQLTQLRALMQLEVHNLPESCASSEFLQRVKSYLERSLRENAYYCVIALDGEQIVATAGVCFYEKPPGISGGTGLNGYVTNVFTKKNYRKMGISRRLMLELNKLAHEAKADKLHLGATSEGFSIYKAVGYKEPKFVSLELIAPFVN
jgi:GNAT superfamily N-acetyltransferase